MEGRNARQGSQVQAEAVWTGTEVQRCRLACLPCRRRKIRCTGPSDPDDDRSTCVRCQRLSLVCKWAAPRTAGRSKNMQMVPLEVDHAVSNHAISDHTVSGSIATLSEVEPSFQPMQVQEVPHTSADSLLAHDLLNDKAELQQILRTYFGTVHYFGFLSYIHEPTLFRLIEAGRHPKNLTAVMVACTLRLAGTHSPAANAKADQLFQGALHIIQKQVYEAYGAIELMTVVLLRQYEQMKGNYSSAWMLWGNAVKMMQFLSLHNFDEAYPQPRTITINRLLSPEALRRLAWSVFFLDCMGDAGRHGVHTVTEDGYQIQLPCDENSFVRGIEVRTESFNRPGNIPCLSPTGQSAPSGSGLGVSGHIIKTSAFRRRILHYKSRIKYMTATAHSMLDDMMVIENELKVLMAELSSDLIYTEDNLYITQRRTAFVLLHALRHNCFIMLAETRLIICSRDPNLHDLAYTWMRDRVRHAYPVSRIVADALRLGVVCDPFVGCLAYTGIEVLLFDTQRLAQIDSSIEPKSPGIIKAIKRLLEMIRVLGAVDNGLQHMRVEACRRIIRRELANEILNQDDWEACQTDHHASGEDDQEFDFRVFRWHRLEHTGKTHAARTPWAPEAILDLDADPVSRDNSRRPSPRPDLLDANAVSSLGAAPLTGSSGYISPIGSFDPFPSTALEPNGDPATDQQESWRIDNRPFDVDFSRFMEEAGYATGSGASDPLSWLPGQTSGM